MLLQIFPDSTLITGEHRMHHVTCGGVMPFRAITIDFWNTMVIGTVNGEVRQQARLERLLATARSCRPELINRFDLIHTAFEEAVRRFDLSWREKHHTPCASEILQDIWDSLELEVAPEQHTRTVAEVEEGVLQHPPGMVEGLKEALAWASQHYRLGIISDTMFTPGRVLRRLLERHDLLQYFDAFVFSDEAGFSKPDVHAFIQAADAFGITTPELVHIGDLRRTDITGARKAGATAVLFTGVMTDPEPGTEPDAVLSHWSDLPALLNDLSNR